MVWSKFIPRGANITRANCNFCKTMYGERYKKNGPIASSFSTACITPYPTSALLAFGKIRRKKVPVCSHPPYCADVSPCDIWLFPKVKIALKGKCFTTIPDIETAMTEQLKALLKKLSRNASYHGINTGVGYVHH